MKLLLSTIFLFLISSSTFAANQIECLSANKPNLSFKINFDILPNGTGKLINFEALLAVSSKLGTFESSNVEDSFITFGAILKIFASEGIWIGTNFL